MASEKKRMIPEPITETTRWKIVADKRHFDEMKAQKEFWCVVALARAVNALRFAQMPLIQQEGDSSPAAMRARYNSLFFCCALFVENVKLVRKMPKHLQHLPKFEALLRGINSKEAKQLQNSSLVKLRNKLVFHFDIKEIGQQLKSLEVNEPIFASGMGTTNAQVYYELADLCTLRAFSGGDVPNPENPLEALKSRLETTSNLIADFATAAEEFIVEVLTTKGWHSEVP